MSNPQTISKSIPEVAEHFNVIVIGAGISGVGAA